jgi:N-methylhydantoinase B
VSNIGRCQQPQRVMVHIDTEPVYLQDRALAVVPAQPAEDAGHGLGDLEIEATVTIRDESCHIRIDSPPQVPYFINSYEGNSYSGVYLGVMMFAQLPPPYNEGLYRCVSVDMGPKGTLCNAKEPAPHMNCTTTPMETLTDAVRLAFEKAMPSKVAASWGHANGLNIAGWDKRHDEEFVTMVLA